MSQPSALKKAFLLASAFLLKHYMIFAIIFTIITVITQFALTYLTAIPLDGTELGMLRFVAFQFLFIVWIPALFLVLLRGMQRKMNK